MTRGGLRAAGKFPQSAVVLFYLVRGKHDKNKGKQHVRRGDGSGTLPREVQFGARLRDRLLVSLLSSACARWAAIRVLSANSLIFLVCQSA